jgi:Helicase HerA, central domain
VLKSLEDAGCQVRYSTRLHAKLILTEAAAIVSSSNLTATAGYGIDTAAFTRNEELGVLIRGDDAVLAELESQFEAIWSSATRVDERTIGIAMDFPTVHRFSFVAIRDVRLGEYATAEDTAGNVILGRICEVTAYNRSFPQLNESIWLTQGYSGAGGAGRVEVPDLQSLFSRPSKEHGFLVTKAFVEPESVFRIARVEVLKHYEGGRLVSPTVPTAPGSDVSRASPQLLRQLLGEGDVRLGTVQHHPDVPVALRSTELFSKHLAVLGMTGSGKSNAIKVLLHGLVHRPSGRGLRLVVIDTHGEYASAAGMIAPAARIIDVRLRRSVLDEEVVRELLRLPRRDEALMGKLAAVAEGLASGG